MFLVTIKSRDKSREKSYNVKCKDENEAKEWGARTLAAQKKDPEDFKVTATPIVIETAKVVEEVKPVEKAEKAKKSRATKKKE